MHPPAALAFVLLLLGPASIASEQAVAPPPTAAPLSDAQRERFLQTAQVLKARELDKGVTASSKATLTDGTLTHDAHVQTIDQYEAGVQGRSGAGARLPRQMAVQRCCLQDRSTHRAEPRTGQCRARVGLEARRIHLVDRRCDDGRRGAPEKEARAARCRVLERTTLVIARIRSIDRQRRQKPRQQRHFQGLAPLGHRSHAGVPVFARAAQSGAPDPHRSRRCCSA